MKKNHGDNFKFRKKRVILVFYAMKQKWLKNKKIPILCLRKADKCLRSGKARF